jgi:hypothetical protein
MAAKKLNMKKILFAFLIPMIAVSLFLVSCDDDDDNNIEETGNLEITFLATYDGEPLVFKRTYDYEGDQQIQFEVSEFYLSDMEMAGPVQLILADIFSVNFEDVSQDENLAEQGIVVTFQDIPAGTYGDLEMGIGVSSDLNSMAPSDFGSGHPLRDESNYWQPWNSYIFSKLEGNLDSLGNDNFDVSYVYHSGKDELYTTINRDLTVEIRPGETTKMNFVVDHRDLLFRGNEALDIKAKPTAHSAGDLEYPRFILENFDQALKLEMQ